MWTKSSKISASIPVEIGINVRKLSLKADTPNRPIIRVSRSDFDSVDIHSPSLRTKKFLVKQSLDLEDLMNQSELEVTDPHTSTDHLRSGTPEVCPVPDDPSLYDSEDEELMGLLSPGVKSPPSSGRLSIIPWSSVATGSHVDGASNASTDTLVSFDEKETCVDVGGNINAGQCESMLGEQELSPPSHYCDNTGIPKYWLAGVEKERPFKVVSGVFAV